MAAAPCLDELKRITRRSAPMKRRRAWLPIWRTWLGHAAICFIRWRDVPEETLTSFDGH